MAGEPSKSPSGTTRFDYSQLPKQSQEPLRQNAREIKRQLRMNGRQAIELGRRLTEARGLARNGTWARWCRMEMGLSPQRAARFMRMAQVFGLKKGVERLPIGALQALLPGSVPPEAREAALAMARKGIRVTQRTALQLAEHYRERPAMAVSAPYKVEKFRHQLCRNVTTLIAVWPKSDRDALRTLVTAAIADVDKRFDELCDAVDARKEELLITLPAK